MGSVFSSASSTSASVTEYPPELLALGLDGLSANCIEAWKKIPQEVKDLWKDAPPSSGQVIVHKPENGWKGFDRIQFLQKQKLPSVFAVEHHCTLLSGDQQTSQDSARVHLVEMVVELKFGNESTFFKIGGRTVCNSFNVQNGALVHGGAGDKNVPKNYLIPVEFLFLFLAKQLQGRDGHISKARFHLQVRGYSSAPLVDLWFANNSKMAPPVSRTHAAKKPLSITPMKPPQPIPSVVFQTPTAMPMDGLSEDVLIQTYGVSPLKDHERGEDGPLVAVLLKSATKSRAKFDEMKGKLDQAEKEKRSLKENLDRSLEMGVNQSESIKNATATNKNMSDDMAARKEVEMMNAAANKQNADTNKMTAVTGAKQQALLEKLANKLIEHHSPEKQRPSKTTQDSEAGAVLAADVPTMVPADTTLYTMSSVTHKGKVVMVCVEMEAKRSGLVWVQQVKDDLLVGKPFSVKKTSVEGLID